MEDEVMEHLAEGFPRPVLDKVWVAQTKQEIKDAGGPDPEDAFDAFMDRIGNTALHTPLSVSAEKGTGLDASLSFTTMCDTIQGPMVLELVHLTDIGISAFELEKVRYNRDRSFHLRLAALATEGKVATPHILQEIRGRLPRYPRKCLRLVLSDGVRELEAVELDPLNIHLGVTPMGTKIQVAEFPIIGGVAYLRPENVVVLGGRVEAFESAHQCRLAAELYTRMQQELVVAQAKEAPIEGLFADHGVPPTIRIGF